MTKEEKIIILGALFHDIGKFHQRCIIDEKTLHTELSVRFLHSFKLPLLKIFNGDEQAFSLLVEIVANHHQKNSGNIYIDIIRLADQISSGEYEKTGTEYDEEPDTVTPTWGNIYLASVLGKLRLHNNEPSSKYLRYYGQRPLGGKDYDFLIPQFDPEKDTPDDNKRYTGKAEYYSEFENDISAVLQLYEKDDDFPGIINLILMIFEKYLWCVPDYTGSNETDISLFNHLKDVTALAHAILLSQSKDINAQLALIVADIPGIQDYIFDIASKKPAKILRGRSIFVQVLSRIIATKFTKSFHLTEASIIMLAGGKFYLLAPFNSADEFYGTLNKTKSDIDNILIRNFNYRLSFTAGFAQFTVGDLRDNRKTFGEIIDEASHNLLRGRNRQFLDHFFGNFDETRFVHSDIRYINDEESDKIKCSVSGQPIRIDRKRILDENSEEHEIVDSQIKLEYELGSNIPRSMVTVLLDENLTDIMIDAGSKNTPNKKWRYKILLNAELEKLLKKEDKKYWLLEASFLTVASFASFEYADTVMDFETMAKKNIGAEYLTLLKGDIDNLGLLMALGLRTNDEKKSLSSISRTTTLSNQLRYFFSSYLNGLLGHNFCNISSGNKESENHHLHEINSDQYVYTVFAGGDDLMLITPHSASIKLLKLLNDKFTEFCCGNPEIHISWSLTNFKHNTPIRIVASFADANQEECKNKYIDDHLIQKDGKTAEPPLSMKFFAAHNKARVMMYNSIFKTSLLGSFMAEQEKLYSWSRVPQEKQGKEVVSRGILRHLLVSAELMKSFTEYGDTSKLIWHPILVHLIKRELVDKHGNFKTPEVEPFFRDVLSISKETESAKVLNEFLHPLVCSVIYLIRDSKINN